ncbi:MAG TPA: DarT ssDNA thymidine ADP-ribosyltransferase family protein [Pseudolysinimonas sp.]|nr:DarT ssDNA thymidine ADP-ribosyltransferase family protein [Pseudolysinimonas sp.]
MADDECIHGFPVGMCDICYPRTPVVTAPVRRTPSPRTPRVAGSAPAAPPFAFATQRFFHVTHIDNLAAILSDGALRADATPEVDVSSPTTRELRAAADLADGSTVAGHVAFYGSPTAARWTELRDGAVGPHWSDAARAAKATEFLLLGVPGSALGDAVVAADADAAAPATRFAFGVADATTLLRRVRAGDPELTEVELLSADPVPVSSIAAITVANEPMRDLVRYLLTEAGAAPKIAVYPPWYATA